METSTQIYKVTTEGDCEGRSTQILGYATGNVNHIKQYFEPKKMYDIRVEPIKVIHITIDIIDEKSTLEREKKEIELKLEALKTKLSRY